MNKPTFRAWDKRHKVMRKVAVLEFNRITEEVSGIAYWVGHATLEHVHANGIILMQSTEMHDEANSEEIWHHDLLEIESPKGKFLAKVEKCYGTFGIVAVKGEISDYFTDHWCESFMPLIDLYWNESGDDGCLPKSRRLGSIHENPELLNE